MPRCLVVLNALLDDFPTYLVVIERSATENNLTGRRERKRIRQTTAPVAVRNLASLIYPRNECPTGQSKDLHFLFVE